MQTINERLQNRPKYVYVIIMIPMVSIFVFSKFLGFQQFKHNLLFHSSSSVPAGYEIYSSKCRIIKLEAFNPDAKKFFERKWYVSCSKTPLLSSLITLDNDTRAVLQINKKAWPKYSKEGVACCYRNISRGNSKGKELDNEITKSSCIDIEGFEANISTTLALEVKCHNSKSKREVYKNVHLPIAKTPSVQKKINNFHSEKRPLSVLIMGIDSISRLNMIRTMPKTRKYLNSHSNWLEYTVYHKIDDNTFPNLIAMLTGMSPSSAWKECNPRKVSGIDKCNFIWKSFGANNYVTSYVEDSAAMSTFNYLKEGFTTPPTDFYARTYQLACNDLKLKHIDNAVYCTGPEMEGERIFKLTQKFVRVFNSTPYFGFFWMNSFSHQQLNTPIRLDDKVASYLEDVTNVAINDSIIIFLSDHGIRFGNIRQTLTGYLEERLPFFFISFPEWFKKAFPDSYANALDNKNKLITPYDIFMTLQDILLYSGAEYKKIESRGCKSCTSIFDRVHYERSCEDASIPTHWCTCYDYKDVDTKKELAKSAAQIMIDNLHLELDKRNVSQKCSKYSLHKIVRVFGSQSDSDFYPNEEKLIVIIETKPEASFEATFTMQMANETLQMSSGFSRLDSYSSSGKCVKDSYLKLICYCK